MRWRTANTRRKRAEWKRLACAFWLPLTKDDIEWARQAFKDYGERRRA